MWDDDSLNILASCTDPGQLASTLVMRWVASHITVGTSNEGDLMV